MSKPFLICAIAGLLAVAGLGIYLWHDNAPASELRLSESEVARKYAEIYGKPAQPPAPAAPKPIDLSHPVRLAVGGLGLANENENQKLGDLVTVDLTGAAGFDLVERQSLSAILRELNLNWSGFMRAKDAVRAGKLLRADWFLLGTVATLNGTNSIVARVVDARTGILLDAGVVSVDKPLPQVAADFASFLRGSRENAAHPKPRTYLALGAFEDLSVNNRQADFPNQLRSYLTAAYRDSGVTLLEREYVETLLREVHLDMAGLTEESWSNPPPVMQSAYWLVDGQYQSYETTNFQIELNLEIQRAFGKSFQRQLRALPGEPIEHLAKAAMDGVINQNASYIFPTRRTEARMQMEAGQELGRINREFQLIYSSYYEPDDPQVAAKQKRRLNDAIRAFQTVLLLEPTNREAKLYLAACLRDPTIRRADEARNLYREILEEPLQDKWTGLAQQALVWSFEWSDPGEKARWFASAIAHNANSAVMGFYRQNVSIASRDVTINSHDENSVELAQKRLVERIRSTEQFMDGKGGASYGGYGLYEFQDAFPDKAAAARAMTDFLPTLEKIFPELAPHLAAEVLWFQVDTNSPAVAEFERTLDWCIAHPKDVFQPDQYWSAPASSAYNWLMWARQYALAVKTMEAWRSAANGKLGGENLLALGYAYMGDKRWQEALGTFESLSNRVVKPSSDGPWGNAFQPVLTGPLTAVCRKKLGLEALKDPREFEFGQPIPGAGSLSAFCVDDNGAWVGSQGRLLHLDFNGRTDLTEPLPGYGSNPITVICPGSSSIWIGTQGGGLIEFDKASHQCRRLTEADGLMMNDIASLAISGDSLWISYGGATGGGLGRLDLRSHKLSSFMASLDPNSLARSSEAPPRVAIGQIVAGTDGDLWLFVAYGVRQYHVNSDVWASLPRQTDGWVYSFCADSRRLVEGVSMNLTEIEIQSKQNRQLTAGDVKKTRMVVSADELSRIKTNLKTNGSNQYISMYSSGNIRPRGALAIQNLRSNQWQILEDADGFPNPPTTLTLDGDNLWVGGEGTIALVDLKENKVKKFCHIKAASVDRLQVAGGYLWAQFGGQLYRVPLSAVE